MPANLALKEALQLLAADSSKLIQLQVGGKELTKGQYISKKEAQAQPTFSLSTALATSLTPDKKYIVIGLDPDAPFGSLPVLGPILHLVQPSLTLTPESPLLASTEAPIATWVAPAPPPPSGPHRYVFLLYEQPEGFDVQRFRPANGKELGLSARVRFDLDKWIDEVQVKGKLVGGNWFTSN